MAIRPTMDTLVTRLRGMIGDPAGSTQVFTDNELQEVLDRNRVDVRYEELDYVTTIGSGGAITYKEFYSQFQNWEEDLTIQDNNYDAITPDTYDYMVGKFTWVADQGSNIPFFVTGKVYDMYNAAAEVLEQWAAKVALEQDIENAGITGTWMNKQTNLLRQADRYRRMGNMKVSTMTRTDLQ